MKKTLAVLAFALLFPMVSAAQTTAEQLNAMLTLLAQLEARVIALEAQLGDMTATTTATATHPTPTYISYGQDGSMTQHYSDGSSSTTPPQATTTESSPKMINGHVQDTFVPDPKNPGCSFDYTYEFFEGAWQTVRGYECGG